MQHGPRPSEEPCGTTSNHDGSICLENELWERRSPFSHQALQRRLQARRAAKSGYNDAEADQPQSTLNPHCRPQGPRRAASSHGGELQQTSDSRCLSQHHHCGDSVRTSDPEHRHPQVPDDGGKQDEESSVVPPHAQESLVGMPSVSGDESGNEGELANTAPSIQPSASQNQANIQHIGCRRRCDIDGMEDCSPIVGSNAKLVKDKDVVQPPRGKRRRVNTSAPTTRRTVPKRQTRLRRTDSPSLQAQRPPTTQGL
ncbi:hypothetical protein N657DRAFT_235516 [Parathielavia appendiculata]|uniref:Uncharacterized protein n=1 Tax=Parathielavia appendiculata TaxID=2587402 RepID=A0AAN6Z6W0_9PEZI|nr:hypothetical protein N657DRAFT_235516 [Parathielavia appendiculata]